MVGPFSLGLEELESGLENKKCQYLKMELSQVWWHMPIIRRLMWEDHYEFEANQNYIERPCSPPPQKGKLNVWLNYIIYKYSSLIWILVQFLLLQVEGEFDRELESTRPRIESKWRRGKPGLQSRLSG